MSDEAKLFAAVTVLVLILLVIYYMLYGDNMSNITTVLMFYRPGCMYCEMFKPEWEIIEQKLGKSRAKKINTASPESTDLVKRFKVNGVPTIIFLDAFGRSENYTGSRTADLILKRISK